MRETRLHLDERGHAWTYADMETTPRDFARLGVLMLNRGPWQGRRVVGEAWVQRSTEPSQDFNRRYGLLWWLIEAPQGYSARGYLDTNLYVFPAHELVVVRMQSRPVECIHEGVESDRGHSQPAGWESSFSGVIAPLSAWSSCMRRLFTPSRRPRIFMSRPPPRPAMTDMYPATSAIVPMFAVSARWRICDISRATTSQMRSRTSAFAARLWSSSATSFATWSTTFSNSRISS